MISVSGTFFKWGPIRHIQGKAQATALKLKKLKYRFKSLSAKIIRSKTSYASDCKTASAVSFLCKRIIFYFINLKNSDTICNIKALWELYKYKDRKRGSESGF